MASTKPATKGGERQLTLQDVVAWLVEDGMLGADKAELLKGLADRGSYKNQHPLEILGKRGWTDARDPRRALTVESLSIWLAAKTGLPYFRIDPLKLDVQRITSV